MWCFLSVACYGKNFGPKGYGYAGGASGLSMDTGKPDDVPTRLVNAYLVRNRSERNIKIKL